MVFIPSICSFVRPRHNTAPSTAPWDTDKTRAHRIARNDQSYANTTKYPGSRPVQRPDRFLRRAISRRVGERSMEWRRAKWVLTSPFNITTVFVVDTATAPLPRANQPGLIRLREAEAGAHVFELGRQTRQNVSTPPSLWLKTHSFGPATATAGALALALVPLPLSLSFLPCLTLSISPAIPSPPELACVPQCLMGVT
ncbi:hypothetical protein BC826DRAFT_143474 [Russula brevipes]|nr:hypothetical protein BC826DRAFT_143474 [Russula brevipes]